MTEFITSNKWRAYPLAERFPEDMEPEWNSLLLDASVCCAEADGFPCLLGVRQLPGKVCLDIRIPGTQSSVAAELYPMGDKIKTLYFEGHGIKAVLTVNGAALAPLVVQEDRDCRVVEIPFVARCVGCAPKFVSAVSGYSPSGAPEVYGASPRTPVKSVGGADVAVEAKDGIDLEVVDAEGGIPDALRISALPAQDSPETADSTKHMMIRGDACFSVEATPNAKVARGGAVVPAEPGESCGVIRVASKCKPCCQCDDYKEAYDSLSPLNGRVVNVQGVVSAAKAAYDAACKQFDKNKKAALDAINVPENVTISIASASTWNSHYKSVVARGRRGMFTVNVTICNTAINDAEISSFSLSSVPSGFEHTRAPWWTIAGAENVVKMGVVKGTQKWTLPSGAALCIRSEYERSRVTNYTSIDQPNLANITASVNAKVRNSKGAHSKKIST